MKRIFALALLVAVPLIQAASSDDRIAYEKALALEEANGRLNDAIALFQKVVRSSTDEALAAQAQLHVGICYEKLARKEARAAYQAVLERYPEQRDAVRAARDRLARLTASPNPARRMTVREFARATVPSSGKIAEPVEDFGEFAVSADGRTFVYTDWNSGDLIVKDVVSGKARGLYGVHWDRASEYFELPVISRDQKRIAYASYSTRADRDFSRIGIDSISGGKREILWEGPDAGVWVRDWSPDGSKLLVTITSPDRSVALAQFDLKTRTPERLVTLNWDTPVRAEYSPDGRFIAYDSTKHGERKIYLLSTDGLQERILVDTPGEDISPLWSPDGRFLIFRSTRSGDCDLLALRMDQGRADGEPLLIKSNIGESAWLRGITADGRLFYGERLAGPEIVLVERNGAQLGRSRILPQVRTRDVRQPAFAPDGKRLAYLAGPQNGVTLPALRIASLDGEILKEIPFPRELRYARLPSFSPDGGKIAVVVQNRKRQNLVVLLQPEIGATLNTFAFDPGIEGVGVSGWSADGRFLYVFLNMNGGRQSQLEKIDTETGQKTSLRLPAPLDGTSTKVSPDGRLLTVKRIFPPGSPGQTVTSKLLLRSLDDGSERELTTELVSFVRWDADSRHLFYRKGNPPAELWRMSIETGAKELVWKDALNHVLASVSLDGRHLAFQKQGGDWRIWVVENFLPAKTTATGAR